MPAVRQPPRQSDFRAAVGRQARQSVVRRCPRSAVFLTLLTRPNHGEQTLMIELDSEMYQPSVTTLDLMNDAGALAAATIGGSLDL